jgi:hypothetical protein
VAKVFKISFKQLRQLHVLYSEEPSFHIDPLRETAYRAVLPDDPVARYYDGDGVPLHRLPDGPRSHCVPYLFSHPEIASHLAVWDTLKHPENFLCKPGLSRDIDGNIKINLLSFQILVEEGAYALEGPFCFGPAGVTFCQLTAYFTVPFFCNTEPDDPAAALNNSDRTDLRFKDAVFNGIQIDNLEELLLVLS